MKENQRIREVAKGANVKLWEVAEKLHITDGMFSRKLRRELDSQEQEKILAIIAEIAQEKEAANETEKN